MSGLILALVFLAVMFIAPKMAGVNHRQCCCESPCLGCTGPLPETDEYVIAISGHTTCGCKIDGLGSYKLSASLDGTHFAIGVPGPPGTPCDFNITEAGWTVDTYANQTCSGGPATSGNITLHLNLDIFTGPTLQSSGGTVNALLFNGESDDATTCLAQFTITGTTDCADLGYVAGEGGVATIEAT